MLPASEARPRIGLTLDAEPPGGYSRLPWYAIRENYCAAIARAGGLPLALPHQVELAADYLDLLDGAGGDRRRVRPRPGAVRRARAPRHRAHQGPAHRRSSGRSPRRALARDLPVLGICGGQQLLNVVLGGDLIQHIPDAVPGCLAHEQPNPRTEPGHAVEVVAGTMLHRIGGCDRLEVNSAHHQAAGAIGPGVVISGRAPDGVIEAIEAPGRRFASACSGIRNTASRPPTMRCSPR